LRKLSFLFLLFCLIPVAVWGQRGRIIRPATTTVMDPNQDGFVSKTTAGFSTDGDYLGEFELIMFGVPQAGGDVAGDNQGPACGIMDLIPDFKGRSVYAVRSGNNLIFRFRVGDDNPSVESWTIMLDTDGLYGATDPNATPNNPGFEADITLIKRNNAGVMVYNIDGIQSCPTPVLSYPINSHFQISIADEVTCGDPDYFYDFYVPFDQLSAVFGITGATGMRFVAVTNVSATCAMSGTIADVSGVDNNAPEYVNCVTCAFTALVDNQCPTALDDLCQTCGGFEKDKVNKPTIDVPVRAGQAILSGTCDDGIYIVAEIYSRTGGTDAEPIWSSTPRETKNTTAAGTNWAVVLSSPLQSYDRIVAKAQKDAASLPCGVTGANQASASVTVVQPNTAPVALNQNINVIEDIPGTVVLTATDFENDPLIFTITTPPVHGSLTGTGPNLIYTPNSNYTGPDSFVFQVSDGIFSSVSPGTISITVTPVNDAPVANNQILSTAEEVAKAIILTGNDIEAGPLTFSIVTGPLHGTLSGTGANITYSPFLNYNGNDSFTFKINDGTIDSNIATVSITVTPVDDPPVANDLSVTISEESVTPLVLTGSDVDGDALAFIIVSPPTHGALSGTGANVTYTPAVNYNGPDSFTFKANDGNGDSNIATVAINITPVNDTPIANDQSVVTPEDVAAPIVLIGSDVDTNPIVFTILTPPLHGALSGTGSAITYTPSTNYNGTDNFTFKVNDGTVDSNIATISITVTPLNDAPVADDQIITTPEDGSKVITLTATDVEGSALTYTVVAPPANGTLSGTGQSVTYTPSLNYFGVDNFTFKVNDGTADSNIATVSITVTPVNDAPVADSQSLNYLLNTAKSIILTGSDVEASGLTFTVVSLPTSGSLSGTAPNVMYTPNAGFAGSDSFSFKANDGTEDSNIATISLFFAPGSNVPPVCDNQTISLNEDSPKSIVLTASDANADLLTYIVIGLPAHGTLTGTEPNLTYTPALNYNGPDGFTFKVNDGSSDSNIATISITVLPVNDLPFATDQSISTQEDIAKTLTLSASDVDLDGLSYSIVTPPAHGTLSGTGSAFTYTPSLNFSGLDEFTFKVNDGSTDSNVATVFISITPVNDLPVANNQSVNTLEEVSMNITLTGSDADLDAITYSLVSPPVHGTLVGTLPNLTYVPAVNYFGTDQLTFKVNDGSGDSNIGTITITVAPVNDVPAVENLSITTPEDIAAPVNISGIDADGTALTYIIITAPQHGLLTGTAPALVYTPAANYNGSDNFTFKANDGTTDSNIGTVGIDITPVADPPTAFSQTGGNQVTTQENVPQTVSLSGIDPDGDPLTYIIVTPPAHGILTGSGSNLTYTPALNYSGPDSFTFKVNDGTSDSNIATIQITVTPISHAPLANNQSLSTAEDTPLSFTLSGSDEDNDPLNYILLTQVQHGSLAGILPNLTFTPDPNYNGPDQITFKVNDGSFDSNIATILLTVTPAADAPTLTGIPDLVTLEDSTLQVCLNATDVDGNAITYNQPANNAGGGTMIRDRAPYDFCYIFTPPPNYNGQSLWTMSVTDATGLVATTAVKITVLPVNDPPTAIRDVITAFRHVPKSGNLLTNDSDIDGDAITLTTTAVSNVMHGSILLLADGSFTYVSEAAYRGLDSLQYEVCDNGTPRRCSRQTLLISVEDEPFKVYEGVSPNGDGNNDYLRIDGIDYFTNNTVQIFDRYNNLVFEIAGYDNEERVWRGQSNAGIGATNLAEGTYFYLIKLGDGSAPIKGFVVLKKN
jgi:gliding motility-associated-like protein